MKKFLALLLALAMLTAIAASCAPAETTPSPSPVSSPSPADTTTPTPEEATPTPKPEKYTYTDSAGREVELKSDIQRVVPSGALAQMFLISIAPDLLVSLSSGYSDEFKKYVPAELHDMITAGQFYGSGDLNLETIATLQPDIIIDLGEPKATIADDMDAIQESLAVPTVHITAYLRETDGQQGVANAFRELGKILGREERAEEIAQYCEHVLALADEVMAKVGDNKVSALYLLGSSGTNVVAATSYHAEVLDWLADNVAIVESPSSKGSGNETDLEQIHIWNPDVIFFASGSYYAEAGSDPTWAGLTAIDSGKYYEVPQGPYNWFGTPPSVQRFLFVLWALKILYPEYATFDLQAEITEYYSLFYGYTLTDAEYHAFMANSIDK